MDENKNILLRVEELRTYFYQDGAESRAVDGISSLTLSEKRRSALWERAAAERA